MQRALDWAKLLDVHLEPKLGGCGHVDHAQSAADAADNRGLCCDVVAGADVAVAGAGAAIAGEHQEHCVVLLTRYTRDCVESRTSIPMVQIQMFSPK